MMLRCHNCFLIVLVFLCAVVALVHAIYDPRDATTKPPKRREPVLPWYSSDKFNSSEDLSRSLKWSDPDNPVPRKPYVVDSGTESWSSWKKKPGSEIEQRTEIANDSESTTNDYQHGGYSLEYSQFEQQENRRFPSNPVDFEDSQRKEENKGKKPSEANDVQTGLKDDQDFYEGIPADSTKPRKEKILLSPQQKPTVARYDSKLGVQCPEFDSTGQFIYPPDCKFFVNCWNGRAFVQPCAPGTLFNPDTLECDFPHKVKCYGGELADFHSHDHLDSSGRQEPLLGGSHQGYMEKEPRCPPQVTGMLPHPSDCTKFLQCANGGTYIMDCGPGTVFNPAISVCDWPNKVRGCEDALQSKEELTTPVVPPDYEDYGHGNLQYHGHQHQPAKKIACPEGYTGYLPHPDTCKKFLQCDRGGTFIMDCGPGTAFNPSISVCDWPYNVPGCSEDKPQHTQQPIPSTTTFRPWHYPHQHNHGFHGHYRPGHTFGYPTQPAATTSRPATDWDALRPTWKPTWKPSTWTTAQPPYFQGHLGNTNTYYGGSSEQHRSRDHDTWGQIPSPGYPGPSSWPHWHGTDQNTNYGNRYPHQHHHHGHPYENNETQQPTPPYGSYPQTSGQETETWNSNRGYQHGYHHHHHGDPHRKPSVPGYSWEPEDSGQQTQQSPLDQTNDRRGPSDGTLDYSQNTDGSLPTNRRIGQELAPNRQQHGRNGPEYWKPGYGHLPIPDRNIYVDHNYTWPGDKDWKGEAQTVQNTSWREPMPTNDRFKPSSWDQMGPGRKPPQNQEWNQGSWNEDDKFREWGSRTNIHQSTADKGADSKLKTNIFQYGKGQRRPELKGASADPSKPSYPNGIYVNINGTRGHFITKEIEVNQGHSKTKTYSPNDLRGPNGSNKNNQNIYVDSQTTNFDHIPSVVLQPPIFTPYNRTVEFNNISQNKNFSSNGHRDPKQFWINNSTWSPGDLVESGTNYNHVAVPSSNLQPPYPSLDKSLLFPFSINFSRTNNYYPPVPSGNLQPPRTNSTFPIGWQHPDSPVVELQPPINEPPDRPEDSFNVSSFQPATNFQPSSQLIPPDFTTNVTGQYPYVPQSNLESPNRSFSDISNHSSDVSSTTQRVPENRATVPPIAPPKKKVLQTREKPDDKETTTTNPNVPTVWVEDENSSPPEYPDTFESPLDADVDVMVDKEVWKPVLVFENKTEATTQPSVIMKINNKKNVDVDVFNLEAAPFEEEEPPFPAYYVPPVDPIYHTKKTVLPTPISGQVIRLRGGTGPHDGYVEVQGMNPGWGVVCDARNSWSLKEANVICKQLGYSRGAEMAWQGRNSRNGVPSWIAANTVSCQGNETRFQSCKFTHEQECRVERDAVAVMCLPNRVAHCRKDEIPYEGQCYHLADPESGLTHSEASEYCSQRQARLLDITNQAENDFISEWLVQKHPEVASIITSGVGFTTMGHTLWLWEDASQAKFKFTKWWPGWMEDKKFPPSVGNRSVCIAMKRKFPCHERPDSICVADYFFWDTEDCASSGKGHSYICKRPYDDIGCVYGKGSQYSGTANVTTSGKDCLPWGDPQVAYPLSVNVLNREVREKLKSHNYCRNPNPNKETRPWCFTGPRGEREHCDIPACGNLAGNIGYPKSLARSSCKPKHFQCLPGECIPSPWVCDGEEDCTNGADEKSCISHMNLFQKYSKHKLEGYDVQKWLNTPLKTCALRCKEADFTCRSFAHKAVGNVCLLSDSDVAMTGSLKPNKEFDYYEMKERSMNCDGMFVCENRKCINQTQVCDGKNDCNDRSDEKICTVESLDYAIRLAGSDNDYEGRVEVKILGVWGQVCDDGFGLIDADVICKELGFALGALDVTPGGYFGNMNPPTRFMVDQLRCRGNESSLRECDFEGWGVHDCQPEEAVGVVCKTAVNTCQDGHWKCDKTPMCIPTAFICDEVVDCADGSDESSEHCDAPFEVRLANGSSPLEGRVEVRHHGIWGTVCDDDFSNATAAVICRSLGYGGYAIAKKDGYFGPGEGPIWLDEVFCYGNETQLNRCEHNHWGQHNCNHDEDAGVICTPGDVNDSKLYWETVPHQPEKKIDDILPANCGRRFKDFNEDEGRLFERVVHGSIAPKGSYPWQASIRIRGHSRSSHWCGAVIISPLHLLTAAHCLEGYNKGTYFVRAGDYNTEIDEGTEAEANIEDYYIHEEFRKGHRMNNDIALVLLKGRGIPLGKNVMPICLPAEDTEYRPGLNCTISGFGSIETGKSTHSKDLRYGWIPLLDQSECRAGHVYGNGAISDGMVCAGYLDEGIDTCDGDSGGPLACLHNGAFTLYGITSWGQHCGKANKPGVYVRVSHYRQWIDQKIRESLGGR